MDVERVEIIGDELAQWKKEVNMDEQVELDC